MAANIVPIARQIKYRTSSVYHDLLTSGFISIVTFETITNKTLPPIVSAHSIPCWGVTAMFFRTNWKWAPVVPWLFVVGSHSWSPEAYSAIITSSLLENLLLCSLCFLQSVILFMNWVSLYLWLKSWLQRTCLDICLSFLSRTQLFCVVRLLRGQICDIFSLFSFLWLFNTEHY